MKTQEELNTLKEEVETLNRKLSELTKKELIQVIGGEGSSSDYYMDCPHCKTRQTVSIGLFYKGLPTYVCNACSGLISATGRPLDPTVLE